MQGKAVINQLRFIASLGLAPQDSIPAAVSVIEMAMPCLFVSLFLVDKDGRPLDAYVANPLPEAMEAFIGKQDELRAMPHEMTLDKIIAAGKVVDAQDAFRGPQLLDSYVYQNVLRPYGIGLGLDLTLRDASGRALAVLMVNRAVDNSLFTAQEKSLLAQLHDLLVQILSAPDEPASGPWSEPPDRSGYLVADAAGAILFAAGEANLLVAQYCGLRFEAGLAYRDLLVRLPPQLRDLVQQVRASQTALGENISPWGRISVRVLKELRAEGVGEEERFQIVLERRLSRRAVVAQNAALMPLSQREREVAFLYGMGEPADRVAAQMQITPATLKAYAKSIYSKLALSGRAGLQAKLRMVA